MALLAIIGATAAAQALAVEGPAQPQAWGSWGFDLSGIDPSIVPGDDFFSWANGSWVARTTIPQDRTGYSSLGQVSERAQLEVQGIVEGVSLAGTDSSDARKIRDAFRAYMDEPLIERLKARPLKRKLAEIRRSADHRAIAKLMGQARTAGYVSAFDVGIGDDPHDPRKLIVSIYPGGLGLPDRAYYLDAGFADQREAYRAYVQAMLRAIRWPSSAVASHEIIEFEERLAEASWTRAERRDTVRMFHPMSLAELAAYAPGVDWHLLLGTAGLLSQRQFIVTSDSAIKRSAAIFASTPLPVLRAWLAYHLVDSSAPYLSKEFSRANFNFQSRILLGQPEPKARWKAAVAFVNNALGQAVGHQFASRRLTAETRAAIGQIVDNLRSTLRERLLSASIEETTRREAIAKLNSMLILVGEPLEYPDYAFLEIDPADLYGNADRARAFQWRRKLAALTRPVDRSDWGNVTAQTVGADYSPSRNRIIIGAGLLEPPFFNPAADTAVNYGGIGVLIAHEMSHAFDDEGRAFDADGRLRDWWAPADARGFIAQAEKLAAQVRRYEPIPGAFVNPQLTMGENIADLIGLDLALGAYRKSLNGREAPVINGFGGSERVFLGFAQAWRIKKREDSVREQLLTDPHPPSQFRANGAVRNLAEWYCAFKVKPGDRLFLGPQDRAQFWLLGHPRSGACRSAAS